MILKTSCYYLSDSIYYCCILATDVSQVSYSGIINAFAVLIIAWFKMLCSVSLSRSQTLPNSRGVCLVGCKILEASKEIYFKASRMQITENILFLYSYFPAVFFFPRQSFKTYNLYTLGSHKTARKLTISAEEFSF